MDATSWTLALPQSGQAGLAGQTTFVQLGQDVDAGFSRLS